MLRLFLVKMPVNGNEVVRSFGYQVCLNICESTKLS